jgi:hypothetical protein
MALLSELIKKVFRKSKSAKKASEVSKTTKNASNEGKKQPIVEGAVIPFIMEDVTLPFIGMQAAHERDVKNCLTKLTGHFQGTSSNWRACPM